ncbi:MULTISPECIES: SusC/RagA family TonB-linked outer membrane protein [Empedobacter]|uniref:SusC/RagA family TonB-linked outer membrane protein n=1 Tax=Empedobacter TaxID=59734 RepID=UPI002576238E|nr:MULTISPECIES: SusC/RagA family TonB-linked outer membrane protein [Empedobacter]MDM1043175.1 SusC/RagA family TonB-linked outer membrane protein [Empedobacter brevis]MDM1137102.1 SusC/RagA family TonB-linked outer membrane protein [Empedobacter sp. R750]
MKKFYFKLSRQSFAVLLGLFCATPLLAQTGKTVTGTVKELQVPLVGVMVKEEGTDNSTFTDDNGHYSLILQHDDAKLIFEQLDFPIREEEVLNRSVINIRFTKEEESIQLKDVVVNAGYYSVKDKERTGSIARVTAKEIENQPVNNVLSAIQGRMAGVSIVQNSGVAGGGFDIQIRGRNSLRTYGNSGIDGSLPLYIIDGIPYDNRRSMSDNSMSANILPGNSISPLNAINPNDILSIEVLKDADATAIYGSRGANGVILITTKRGASGKVKFTFNTFSSLSKVNRFAKLMNTSQFNYVRETAFNNDKTTVFSSTAYDVNGAWDRNRYTDWQKELIGGIAYSNTTQLGISGGSERTNFSLSANHNEEGTVFPGKMGYKRNTIASSIHHQSVDNRLKIISTFNYSSQSNNLIATDYTKQALRLAPNAPALYNEDGKLNWQNGTWTNPLAALEARYKNTTTSLVISSNIEYEILKNIQVRLNTGLTDTRFEETLIRPSTMNNPNTASANPASSYSAKNNGDRISYIVEPQMAWHKKYLQHKLDFLIGGTFQHDKNTTLGISGTGFTTNALIYNISTASNKQINQNSDLEYKYAAVFGRFNYQLNDRYIINLTGRRDGSSRFGPNNRFANFGAIGAAWIFSKEHFLSDQSWLSFGKLRGSYGITGNDNIGDYQYLDTYTVKNLFYDEIAGLEPSRLFNPDFSWEKTRKLEIALELGLLNNRVNMTAGWYQNRSSNQLVGIPLPATTGFSSVQANLAATIENVGWEFTLNTLNIEHKKWKWNTYFNLSIPQNRLLKFPNLEGSTYANQYVIGQSIDIKKVYEFLGIDKETGLYRFRDYNGDGNLTLSEDAKALKKVGIYYQGGIGNTIEHKNWNLDFLFQFVKQQAYNYNQSIAQPGSLNNLPVDYLDHWQMNNTSAKFSYYTAGKDTNVVNLHRIMAQSDQAISDASYIRLKNVNISYKIPLKNSIVQNAKLFFQGQNLLTITNFFGQDPEMLVSGYLPPLKTYAFGVQLTF